MMLQHIPVFALATALFLGKASSSIKLSPILPVGNCTQNYDCSSTIQNSYCDLDRNVDCNFGVCLCLSNLVPVQLDPSDSTNITCISQATSIGDSCQHDLQCTSTFGSLSKCDLDTSTCQCNPGTIICQIDDLHVNKCVYRGVRRLGDPCDGCSSQCGHISHAECSYNSSLSSESPYRCRCETGYIPSTDTSICIPRADKLGDSCRVSPEQCKTVLNSVCDPDTKTCICNSNNIPSPSQQSCLSLRGSLNMECEHDSQCLPINSSCISGSCSCPTGFIESEAKHGTCLTIGDQGQSCEENIQCQRSVLGRKGECSQQNMICGCKQGYIFVNNLGCYPMVPLAGSCEYYQQCVSPMGTANNMNCVNGKCQCMLYYAERNGACYEKKIFDEECERDFECRFEISGPAVCRPKRPGDSKTCQCDEQYTSNYHSSTGYQCLPP